MTWRAGSGALPDELELLEELELDAAMPELLLEELEATVPELLLEELEATAPELLLEELEATVPELLLEELEATVPELLLEAERVVAGVDPPEPPPATLSGELLHPKL